MTAVDLHQKNDELFMVYLHCILIIEDVREAYLMYNLKYLNDCLTFIKEKFPSLYIFKQIEDIDIHDIDPDMPGMIPVGNYNISASRFFISKKVLTSEDINTDNKIGKLLGYNSLFDPSAKYNYSFHIIKKNSNNINYMNDMNDQLFNYICNEINITTLQLARNLTDKIKIALNKYMEIEFKIENVIAKISLRSKISN